MQYIIGIDLGTTNSTLAFTSKENLDIRQFEITQPVSETMEAKKNSLPSFYFFPLQEQPPSLGWYAQERGSELPDRVIASAKSWLCHDMIDRRTPFLPLGDCEKKQSPVAISAAFLSHLRTCWDKAFAEATFSEQTLLVTVPASFDPGARELVTEAAAMANFGQMRLMEEPLAAFYAWLYKHQNNWREILHVNDTVLIIDIGGGTTDFSLISVTDSAGNLSLERKAVGNHVLLGGDNIDLSLAHFAGEKFSTQLDDWQFKSLVHACRQAKERLLGVTPPDHIAVTIPGRGSRLIGGALSATLKREEVEHLLVDGFFPRVSLSEPILQYKHSAIADMGLPFAKDPRVTAQLAHFLSQAGTPLPSAVLFNGGTMKAESFQKRILSVLREWKNGDVKNLDGADLDFGVSQGAAYYGWALTQQKGIRVRAATCRSYFIGVEGAAPAVPGVSPPLRKIRLVPFGMEEGSEITLENQRFSLVLEEPAHFRFFCQNSPSTEAFTELHPLETILQAQGEEGKTVLVKLTAKLTELGLLELWCVAEDGRKWKLEFDVRNASV